MTTITLFLLIVIGDSSFDHGAATVIDRFSTENACEAARFERERRAQTAKFYCKETKVLR